jgi:glucokinase
MTTAISAGAPAPLVVGVEVADGGTRLVASVRGAAGARRWQIRLPAPPTPEEAEAQISALVARVQAEQEQSGAGTPAVAGLGVALWGRVEARRGVVRALPPAADWDGVPLAERLAATWHAPVRLATATYAAALAEALVGAGASDERVLYVLLARGVTAAMVADGEALEGAHRAEGQLGHWRVSADGPRCSCGQPGHLEPLASAQALVRTMIGRAVASEASTAAMLRIAHGRAEAMSAAQVVQLAAEGDPIAQGVVGDALDALALALANCVALLAPDTIVIGGPLAQAGEAFFLPLQRRVEALCRTYSTPPPLVPAALEPHAVLAGAVALARLAAGLPAA